MVLASRRLRALTVLGCLIFPAATAVAAAKPAIVLVAPSAGAKAFETCKYIENKVRVRFPDHEIRWAYPSQPVREKGTDEQPGALPDLIQTLEDLKTKGVTQAAVQSLQVIPGEEWQQNVAVGEKNPGLRIAFGKPLLSSLADRKRLLAALAKDFPADFKENAVLLVGPGSPSPEGKRDYLSLYTLMLSTLKGKNVFFGITEGLPELKTALARINKSPATKVIIVPLTVAGDEFHQDILGDQSSIKFELLAAKPWEIQVVNKGLGHNDGVIQIYLDHLAAALETFVEKKKEKKKKKGKKR